MESLQGAKYRWKLPTINTQAMLDIASSYNLSLPIAQTLVTRGYVNKTDLDSFLFSSFERDVADAALMKDAIKAVERIEQAIKNKEKILICGDYDVDGITSSSLMLVCLLPLGADINFFLPHRVKDGYGLSSAVVRRAAQNGYKVIITVDNGITAFEPAQVAKEVGIDLIITDHHKPHEHVPDAYAIVNPNQVDCPYPFKVLAGVGVSFKLLSLLYAMQGLQMPAKAYELLLLGTVADVVPLLGENRFWVRHGLSYINRFESPSFKVLKQNSNVTKARLSATDIGFSITPQINALGRLEDPRSGVKFLIGSDIKQTEEVGKVLFELNQARKEIERSIVADIEAQIVNKTIDLEHENIIMAASNSWPPGVIGLVASRMVGAYGKPTLLFHISKDGLAKGSCRSIAEFNMFNALQSCSDIIKQFGGHAQAAGLSLPIDNLPQLKERLEALVAQQLTKEDLQLKMALDAQVTLPDLTKKFVDDLHHLEPFGHANPQPLFHVKQVMLVEKPTLLKDAHVKCRVFADGVIKPVIFFNRPELFDRLLNQSDEPFDIAAQVVENHWNDRVNIELQGLDVAHIKERI
ncbi:MAG TPA: single-stranded-DNA-specific exonuclease RecJ [Candidatus Babeliales bacterium]|nr:single-stranded-DNA-specific exonuclease RecJ [Candidatus Babeliales bacterium]